MTIGDRLKEWRDKRGITQKILSEKSGISQGMIYKIERGIASPSIPTAERIAEALNIPVSFLIEPNQDILGEAKEIQGIISDLDEETKKFLNITNKDYIILAKDMKDSGISVAEAKAALEIIKKYKQENKE